MSTESARNRLLPRTWALSKHRHNPADLGVNVMHVRETKPHALSHANTVTTEEQQELERREREALDGFSGLDPVDREILRLSLARTAARERTMPFPASSREHHEEAGWYFVRYEKKGRIAMMTKSFIGHLRQEDIAAQVGLSVYQVRRRLNGIPGDVVRFAELRGWV